MKKARMGRQRRARSKKKPAAFSAPGVDVPKEKGHREDQRQKVNRARTEFISLVEFHNQHRLAVLSNKRTFFRRAEIGQQLESTDSTKTNGPLLVETSKPEARNDSAVWHTSVYKFVT